MNHQESRRPQARILPSARSKSEEESDDLMNNCGNTDHHQDHDPGPSTSKNLRLHSSASNGGSTFHQLLSEPDHHPPSSDGAGNTV